jgi:hypothetical protein
LVGFGTANADATDAGKLFVRQVSWDPTENNFPNLFIAGCFDFA